MLLSMELVQSTWAVSAGCLIFARAFKFSDRPFTSWFFGVLEVFILLREILICGSAFAVEVLGFSVLTEVCLPSCLQTLGETRDFGSLCSGWQCLFPLRNDLSTVNLTELQKARSVELRRRFPYSRLPGRLRDNTPKHLRNPIAGLNGCRHFLASF